MSVYHSDANANQKGRSVVLRSKGEDNTKVGRSDTYILILTGAHTGGQRQWVEKTQATETATDKERCSLWNFQCLKGMQDAVPLLPAAGVTYLQGKCTRKLPLLWLQDAGTTNNTWRLAGYRTAYGGSVSQAVVPAFLSLVMAVGDGARVRGGVGRAVPLKGPEEFVLMGTIKTQNGSRRMTFPGKGGRRGARIYLLVMLVDFESRSTESLPRLTSAQPLRQHQHPAPILSRPRLDYYHENDKYPRHCRLTNLTWSNANSLYPSPTPDGVVQTNVALVLLALRQSVPSHGGGEDARQQGKYQKSLSRLTWLLSDGISSLWDPNTTLQGDSNGTLLPAAVARLHRSLGQVGLVDKWKDADELNSFRRRVEHYLSFNIPGKREFTTQRLVVIASTCSDHDPILSALGLKDVQQHDSARCFSRLVPNPKFLFPTSWDIRAQARYATIFETLSNERVLRDVFMLLGQEIFRLLVIRRSDRSRAPDRHRPLPMISQGETQHQEPAVSSRTNLPRASPSGLLRQFCRIFILEDADSSKLWGV
ncbi:hypothetical protein HYFRA_00008812 [Hymenoscyphus fraxineus]|uniref:Uncharacterized protein n=1 Tax=Hymenoscyphus fraxineus TaxID=746836 RepID=A0A9N9PUT3_9HELO|nr:hypothetical protein HYFRA_00008812 [Hymenoscyphus fraxineus]